MVAWTREFGFCVWHSWRVLPSIVLLVSRDPVTCLACALRTYMSCSHSIVAQRTVHAVWCLPPPRPLTDGSYAGESTPRSRLGLGHENTPPTDIRLTFSHSSCHFPIAAARRVQMDHIQPFSCAALGSSKARGLTRLPPRQPRGLVPRPRPIQSHVSQSPSLPPRQLPMRWRSRLSIYG